MVTRPDGTRNDARPGTTDERHLDLTPVAENRWAATDPAGNVRRTVTSREEVRPMNAVPTWVLPLVVTAARLT